MDLRCLVPPRIAIKSPAGGGKDWLLRELQRCTNDTWVRLAFADPIYSMMSLMTGLSVADLESLKDGRVDPEMRERLPPSILNLSGEELKSRIRLMMQRLGTELGRDVWARDVWVHALLRRLGDLESENPGIVVTDLRFRDEFEALREAGFLMVYLDAPVEFLRIQPEDPKYLHPSERDLDAHLAEGKFDLILTNDRKTLGQELVTRLLNEWNRREAK